MNSQANLIDSRGNTLEIIAFRLNDQQFCVMTTTIREIRGWSRATSIPHAPPEVTGIMNLRGQVIPIIDLSLKLGMPATMPNERSAIVVAEVHGTALGLLVDQVSDILTVRGDQIQPLPEFGANVDGSFADGIIPNDNGMICFLNLNRMFQKSTMDDIAV